MPSPLKKIQERFIPEGNIENLFVDSSFVADNYDPPSLGVSMSVMDGEYKGEPVTDYLHIQESKKTPGEMYISRKGKLERVLRNALTKSEYNALADALGRVEATREAWLPAISDALNNAENPALRAVVVQNDPEDESNRRNKLTKEPDEIGPYRDPKEVEKTRKKAQAPKRKAQKATDAELDELSDEDVAQMEQALGA